MRETTWYHIKRIENLTPVTESISQTVNVLMSDRLTSVGRNPSTLHLCIVPTISLVDPARISTGVIPRHETTLPDVSSKTTPDVTGLTTVTVVLESRRVCVVVPVVVPDTCFVS